MSSEREAFKVLAEYGPKIFDSTCRIMDVHTAAPKINFRSKEELSYFVSEKNGITTNLSRIIYNLEKFQKRFPQHKPTFKEMFVYGIEEEIPHYVHCASNPDLWKYSKELLSIMTLNYFNGYMKEGDDGFRNFTLQKSHIESVGKKTRALVEEELKFPPRYFDGMFATNALEIVRRSWDRIRESADLMDEVERKKAFDFVSFSLSEFMGRQLALKLDLEGIRDNVRKTRYKSTEEDFEAFEKTKDFLLPGFEETFPFLRKGFIAMKER